MIFLQPLLLFSLPLVALPILIHLFSRHRHRTMPWAAMMFLHDAKRMTRGVARLRYILILAARTAAVAGLIFALCRPLASGRVGLALGGAPGTTIVLLDRSASMEQISAKTGRSKRETGLEKLAELLGQVRGNTQLVLIESTNLEPRELNAPSLLVDHPLTSASATSADLPAMALAALDYITTNQAGRTDVWICSDLRADDWDPLGGRWDAVRQGFAEHEGVRFYLLSYPRTAHENVAVEVQNLRRRAVGDRAELVMDLRLTRESESTDPLRVPLDIVINGARSALEIELTGVEYTRRGHTIPLDSETTSGWGWVEAPNDSNPADNVFRFVFAESAVRRTIIVSDDAESAETIRAAAASPADKTLLYEAQVLPTSRIEELAWDDAALVVWHAPLPDGIAAEQLRNFAASGRGLLFLPPESDAGNELFGFRWGKWRAAAEDEPIRVAHWRDDADLLADTQSGSSLPLADLETYQYRELTGESLRSLAGFDGEMPLLARATTATGSVYCLTTLPSPSCSNLGQEGVVFYVMLQRALAQAASALGAARHFEAGTEPVGQTRDWQPVDEAMENVVLSQRSCQSGVYRTDDRLIALNRPSGETMAPTSDTTEFDALLDGLDHSLIVDDLGAGSALASEIWRAFLVVMALALIGEALLCMPEKRIVTKEQTEEADRFARTDNPPSRTR